MHTQLVVDNFAKQRSYERNERDASRRMAKTQSSMRWITGSGSEIDTRRHWYTEYVVAADMEVEDCDSLAVSMDLVSAQLQFVSSVGQFRVR
jgi:hypothetical protein